LRGIALAPANWIAAMGLDSVEIVMSVEEEFGVTIPDVDASRMLRVGELIKYVVQHARQAPSLPCPTAHAFYHLRRTLLESIPISRSEVRLTSSIAALLPIDQRQRIWGALAQEGFSLPLLQRPEHIVAATTALVIVLTAILSGLTSVFIGGTWAVVAIALLLAGWLAGAELTRHLAVDIPPSCATIRDLVLSYAKPVQSNGQDVAMSEREIALKVRSIVAQQMGYAIDEVTEKKRFYQDLDIT